MPKFILNIPNVLTLSRIVMIPLVCLPLLPIFGVHTFHKLLTVTIFFSLSAITDFLDGMLARKLNQMTEWGAYMDPLVDKFLIWGVFGMFIAIPFLQIPIWTFFIILVRDIIVTKMRNYAILHQLFFKTSFLAKVKTAAQMIVCFLLLLFMIITYMLYKNKGGLQENYLVFWLDTVPILYYFPQFLMILVSILTGYSGFDYFIKLHKQLR